MCLSVQSAKSVVKTSFPRFRGLRAKPALGFTILRQGEQIVAFSCGLGDGNQHALLLVGLDYSVNPDADLYINLMFRGLKQALVPGVHVVHFSATADQFKQRAGCRGAWLSMYVKAGQ